MKSIKIKSFRLDLLPEELRNLIYSKLEISNRLIYIINKSIMKLDVDMNNLNIKSIYFDISNTNEAILLEEEFGKESVVELINTILVIYKDLSSVSNKLKEKDLYIPDIRNSIIYFKPTKVRFNIYSKESYAVKRYFNITNIGKIPIQGSIFTDNKFIVQKVAIISKDGYLFVVVSFLKDYPDKIKMDMARQGIYEKYKELTKGKNINYIKYLNHCLDMELALLDKEIFIYDKELEDNKDILTRGEKIKLTRKINNTQNKKSGKKKKVESNINKPKIPHNKTGSNKKKQKRKEMQIKKIAKIIKDGNHKYEMNKAKTNRNKEET